MSNKEVRTILSVYFKLMSIISSIDNLSDSVLFKHKLKMKSNEYLKVVESSLKPLLSAMDEKELDSYTNIVNKIDDFVDSIEIEY